MDTREAMAAKLRDVAQALNPMHRGETWAQCVPEVQARWLAAADVALVAERAAYLRGFAEAREMALDAAHKHLVHAVSDGEIDHGGMEHNQTVAYVIRSVRAMKPEGEL